eukprot:TRINITY_DN189_c0_g2_i1.p1 TRINITY_DN189_c0_g2~~TRINITY_DN189_c0_g2_i1.p1  ORF type:complete len:228 (+),score=43.07 TRINITY_DN189_c0_g2_i1:147-830(+)
MSSQKLLCLCICSSREEGVDVHSFVHFFTLASASFNVHVVTPEGQPMFFVNMDEESSKWVADFRTKQLAKEQVLETVNPKRYDALILPSCPGALYDLASSPKLGNILESFVEDQKPICACGYGVAGLLSAKRDREQSWAFKGYSMTAPCLGECIKLQIFAKVPLIPCDAIMENGGSYSEATEDGLHVIIDRHLITGQNEKSSLLAAQNLLIMASTRYTQKQKHSQRQ